MNMKMKLMGLVFFICFLIFQSPIAKIAYINRIEGQVTILRKSTEKSRKANINTPINIGDIIFSGKESFAEIIYNSGVIVRLDEETKIIIEDHSATKTKTKTSLGAIWVNARKLVAQKSQFELSTPTATAAIRGTAYNLEVHSDSTTEVKVFNGKVAVGPGSNLVKKMKKKPGDPFTVYEIPGPEEIPGPFEVPLEEWRIIVAGQMISVRKDGKFSQENLDAKEEEKNLFIKKNLQLDSH